MKLFWILEHYIWVLLVSSYITQCTRLDIPCVVNLLVRYKAKLQKAKIYIFKLFVLLTKYRKLPSFWFSSSVFKGETSGSLQKVWLIWIFCQQHLKPMYHCKKFEKVEFFFYLPLDIRKQLPNTGCATLVLSQTNKLFTYGNFIFKPII